VGDPTPEGWRGWARILADAIGGQHHVSFYTLAPGAIVADVRREQRAESLAHRPVIASLVVGLGCTDGCATSRRGRPALRQVAPVRTTCG
jgi:hypothetical protein